MKIYVRYSSSCSGCSYQIAVSYLKCIFVFMLQRHVHAATACSNCILIFRWNFMFRVQLHVQFYINFILFSRSVCYFLIWLQPHVQIASSCCDTQHEDAMFVLQIRILHVQTAAPWPNCNFMTTLQPHNLIATSCSDCNALFFFFPCVSQAVCPSAFMVAVCGPRVMNSAWWEGEIRGGRGAGRGVGESISCDSRQAGYEGLKIMMQEVVVRMMVLVLVRRYEWWNWWCRRLW